VAKAVNFGLAYGQGAYGLAQATGLALPEAQKFIDAYFDRFAASAVCRRDQAQSSAIGYVET